MQWGSSAPHLNRMLCMPTPLDEFALSPTHIEPLQSVDHGNNVIDDGERR